MRIFRHCCASILAIVLNSCGLPDKQFKTSMAGLATNGPTDFTLVGTWIDAWGLGTHMDSALYEHRLDIKAGGAGTHRFTIMEDGKVEHTNEAALTWKRVSTGRFTAHLEPAGTALWGRIKGDMDLQILGDQLIDTNRKHVFAKAGSPAVAQEYASAQQQIQNDHDVLGSIMTVGLGAAAGAAIGNAAISHPDATRAILDGVTKAALNGSGGTGVLGGSEPRYDLHYQMPGGQWTWARNITAAEVAQLKNAADDIHVPGYKAYEPEQLTKSPMPPQYVPYKNGN